MKVITNPTDKDITIGVLGYDYTLPAYKQVLVEEDVAIELKTLAEFLDVSAPSSRKGPSPVPKADRKKTASRLQSIQDEHNKDMKVEPRAPRDATSADGVPNGVDKDGVEWVGEGVEIDN